MLGHTCCSKSSLCWYTLWPAVLPLFRRFCTKSSSDSPRQDPAQVRFGMPPRWFWSSSWDSGPDRPDPKRNHWKQISLLGSKIKQRQPDSKTTAAAPNSAVVIICSDDDIVKYAGWVHRHKRVVIWRASLPSSKLDEAASFLLHRKDQSCLLRAW